MDHHFSPERTWWTDLCDASGQLISKYVPKPMAVSKATLSIAFSCPHIPTRALQTAREHMTDIVASLW